MMKNNFIDDMKLEKRGGTWSAEPNQNTKGFSKRKEVHLINRPLKGDGIYMKTQLQKKKNLRNNQGRLLVQDSMVRFEHKLFQIYVGPLK